MGQGYSLTTLSAGSAGIDVPELNDLTYEKSLGDARFMKSIRARHKQGLVVTKVVMKPYASMKLDAYVKELQHEKDVLRDVPNALEYHRILETSTNGYLVRQFIHSSLYDRISTRPFLEDIERKWLAFQLLCAVRDCHSRNVYHGDIKAENTLVTSWNWLLLSDFSSSFKPTYLPEDNPADFSFYFDTSGRRTCYLAPERFLEPGSRVETKGKVNWAMDIFSVGCVIAELFIESPIFTLSQLFKYRRGEYHPEHVYLRKIQDDGIRELVSHMIQLDPESRYSADEYLNFWRGRSFPEYFYGFLHQYMYVITDPSSGQKPITAGEENLGESDDRIDRVYYDFDKISYFLGYENLHHPARKLRTTPKSANNLYPLHIDLPNNGHQAMTAASPTTDDGTLIFLTLIVSSVRSTARAAARIRACELLLAFAERVTDEAKLDRIVPYLVVLLNDKSDIVKVAAVRTLTQVLALVSVISPVNAYIFPEYLLPRLQTLAPGSSSKPSPLLRATYASSLATLATTASRFIDMMQSLRVDGALPSTDPEAEDGSVSRSAHQTLFDVARDDLVGQFEMQTKAFLTDGDSAVKRAFLGSVSSLCVFFGSTKANDVILSHLNTYLNDRDWMLKCAFFEAIVGVATYVGGTSLEEFILPLMVQALTDPEEFVVERVLRSFSSMADLGLFQRSRIWELVDVVGRFTMHPNIWIREAAAQFLSMSTKYLSVADCHSIITPLISPYLKVIPSDLSELQLLDSLKKPMPRLVLDMAYTWSTAANKGLFWKQAQQQRTFSFGADDSLPIISARELGPKALSRTPKNEEDETWLKRLRNAGMKPDDDFKLMALREFIWRVAHRRYKDDNEQTQSKYNTIVSLKDLGVTPQTVFFINGPDLLGLRSPSPGNEDDEHPHTIEDALLDASTEDSSAKRDRPQDARVDRLSKDHGTAQRRGSAPPSSLSSSPGAAADSSGPSDTENGKKRLPLPTSKPTNTTSSESSPRHGAQDAIRLGGNRPEVQRKNSAIKLMTHHDSTSKATAETGTTSANAFGKVDVASRDAVARRSTQATLALAKENKSQKPWEIKFQAGHTYKGHDPNILQLLDTLYLENYPLDRVEFGPDKKSISGRYPIRYSNGRSSPTPWRPEGVFVAMMGEHTGAINRVVVAPDHAFFITGSDDGTIKVWDASRLERNIAHRSRQTFRLSPGAKVTSLSFVEDTHAFVATGSDSSVHVVKVDYIGGGAPYGKLQVLRSHSLPQDESAVWSEHYKSESQSILLLATNRSRLVALELRSMTQLWALRSPVQHGTPTCFAIGPKARWLLLGTSHGVLELYDLRFRLRLKAWCFAPGPRPAAPITRICMQYQKSSRRPRVVIAGGTGLGDVSVWEMQKLTCLEVYRTGVTTTNPATLAKDVARTYKLLDVDDEQRPGSMLARFAASPLTDPAHPQQQQTPDRSVQALALGTHVVDDASVGADAATAATAIARTRQSHPHHFFLSAGPDWKVRFWDVARPDASVVVSGLGLEEARPTFGVAGGTADPVVVVERVGASSSGGGSGGGKPSQSAKDSRKPAERERGDARKPSRSSLISAQQQHLLTSHLDTVTDVALLEQPYGMVVSVDRSGMIYVFQ